jgi:hypothetical protein
MSSLWPAGRNRQGVVSAATQSSGQGSAPSAPCGTWTVVNLPTGGGGGGGVGPSYPPTPKANVIDDRPTRSRTTVVLTPCPNHSRAS